MSTPKNRLKQYFREPDEDASEPEPSEDVYVVDFGGESDKWLAIEGSAIPVSEVRRVTWHDEGATVFLRHGGPGLQLSLGAAVALSDLLNRNRSWK